MRVKLKTSFKTS